MSLIFESDASLGVKTKNAYGGERNETVFFFTVNENYERCER